MAGSRPPRAADRFHFELPGSCYHRPARELSGAPRSTPLHPLANIKQQKKRVRIQARQRLENLRYRSTIKTLTKRLEVAAGAGDAERIATEHRELVRTIDRAATRGALHRNTAARKKSQAARLAAGVSS
ncbi:MAG: 30S ribosomal protein S20 [Actinobacteria bacterium]|nr:30S ribosomal protein S20 [Actinomycetota bacterium]